jgi:hypothetical protein
MYCPQCGQQQVSDELRFCSRCGFQLEGVTRLLSTGGESHVLNDEDRQKSGSPRREGVRHGVLLMFAAMVLIPLSKLFGEPGQVLPVTLMMLGLVRILYAVIFQERDPRRKKSRAEAAASSNAPTASPQQMKAGTRGSALPPPQGIPVEGYNARRLQTAEIVQPPSVTERTTKLLDNRDE